MKLSIIIVNYNVRYFLEQCLKSVYRALDGIEAEVFVVDNNSVDGSVDMVQEQFPDVKLIANKHNPGFAKANNQAIRQAQGKYILLLNPDTVVQEDTFSLSIDFMEAHPDAGGLGIKMIDGKGNYLPESKRGLPTPWVAFYKIFGLTRFFPRSRVFARYYLGHLDHQKNQEVEVLAGAYMLMPKAVLDKIGPLDEDFFMYGEDIDLSYRILKGGYKNYYLADSSIIHYKGESTKKGSLNYVFIFYKAMVIFAKKHFSHRYARAYSTVIHLAIYFRAALAIINRLASKAFAPAVDIGLMYAGMYYIKLYWENNHRFVQGGEYPPELMLYAVPSYILIWLSALFFSGVYDGAARLGQLLKGVFWGSVAILVAYSLLPEAWRFSRAIIVLGAFWAGLSLPAWRYFWTKLSGKALIAAAGRAKRVMLVGSLAEVKRVEELIKKQQPDLGFCGLVSADKNAEAPFLGNIEQLSDLCRVFEVEEVVFCSADLKGHAIFQAMNDLNPLKVEIKIAPPESQFIIGSNSIHSQGSWYAMEFKGINKVANRRAKRLFDIMVSLFLFLLWPLMMWFPQKKWLAFKNIFYVLSGQKTWVGYHPHPQNKNLPPMAPGIVKVSNSVLRSDLEEQMLLRLNQLYAKEYRWQTDLGLLWLGRSNWGSV
jgi:GT2 family glycosyltransferase